MVGAFSENKSGFVIVNEVEHGGNDTATLRSFRPLLKIFVWPVPLSRGGCCSGGYSLMQGFCSSLFFHHWLIWTELSGGLFSFRCFLAIRFSEMTLCGSGGAFRPRGASGRRLFHYSGPLPAGNRNNGRIRPGMRGERRGNGKFQKSVKIILVNTVQNHDAWHTPPAFCLSAEAFPFIVMHGPCPVPVVQWIERVSPKD